MSRFATDWRRFVPLLAAALALAAGLQLLRSLVAGMSVYLGQVRDVEAPLLGGAAAVIFLTALAAPLVGRALGARRALLGLAGLLALLRLAEQLAGSAEGQLVIALAGVVVWLWLLPLVLTGAYGTCGAAPAGGRISPAAVVLLALLLDTALKGAFGTLDLGAASGAAALAVGVALTVGQLGLLFWLSRLPSDGNRAASAPPTTAFALGPLLALHLLIFQNLARQTVLLGVSTPAAFALTLAANLAALGAALALTRRGAALPRWSLLAATGIAAVSAAPGLPAALSAMGMMLGPVAAAVLLVAALDEQGGGEGGGWGWAATGLGLLAIPVVLFGWYARYETALPIPQWALVVGAALLAGAAAAAPAARAGRQPPRGGRWQAGVLLGGLLLLLLPLAQWASWDAPRAAPTTLDRLRVMTYNMHQGYDWEGRADLEGIARVIEAAEAQIVGLQEVPRGWLINGGVDALSWLGQRLGMHTAWGPASDRLWGNAVLSRYPIVWAENRLMPNNDQLRLERAYLTVGIEAGGEFLQVVVTHLHHIGREPHLRLPQVQALIDGVDWSRPTILLGDLNAQPHHRELRPLWELGLAGGEPPLPTFPSDAPRRQLDYVLSTADYEIVERWAAASTASDHLPVVSVLSRRGE